MATVMQALFGRLLITGRSCCRSPQLIVYQTSQRLQCIPNPGVITRRLFFNASPNTRKPNLHPALRKYCTPGSSTPNSNAGATSSVPQKLSLIARFKVMYKDYWYVLLPVHIVTSVGWFGCFYKISASGVDVGYYLRKLGVNETLIKHITESGMGHITVAWALYKVATPARYAITLGGTHASINVLRNMGYIKPAKELMAKGRNKIQSLKDKQLPKK